MSIEKLMAKVEIDKVTGCWLWQGAKRKGYGAIRIESKLMAAHRLSYELHNGAIINGLFVCHKCDVKKCINPEHLFLGTNYENSMDYYKKGASALKLETQFKIGRKATNRSLCDDVVCNIKMLVSQGLMPREIAKITGVKKETIRDIRRGNTYVNVTVPTGK